MNRPRRVQIVLIVLLLPQMILPPRSILAGIFGERKGPADGPITLQQAAAYVDTIERRLFSEGTIGVSVPDVWGQNRMTVHRAEYETQMASRLGQFQLYLQAVQNRTDLSALTNATLARSDRRGGPVEQGRSAGVDCPEKLPGQRRRYAERRGNAPVWK